MSATRSNSESQESHSDSHLKASEQLTVDVASGLFTGVFCSGLFNPWDRGLYLSVKNNKPFLSVENFISPYQGFSQAIIQRAFLGSIYYIMQGEMKSNMYPYLHNNIGISESATQFCIGMSAGSMSGIFTNNISAIKYHTWGQENRSFSSSVGEMWSLGGIKPFIKGTGATIGRDMVFGSTYEVVRNLLKNTLQKPSNNNFKDSHFEFMYNTIAAGIATVISGPLNYVRNVQYATPPDRNPPTISGALRDVLSESKNHTQQPLGRLRFLQQQFRVGWGTARVAVGMAVGQKVFDIARSKLTELHSDHSKNNKK